MPDMTPEQVRAVLASMDLSPQDDEDLQEVTHRINAIRQALAALELPELDEYEPVTIFPIEEAQS